MSIYIYIYVYIYLLIYLFMHESFDNLTARPEAGSGNFTRTFWASALEPRSGSSMFASRPLPMRRCARRPQRVLHKNKRRNKYAQIRTKNTQARIRGDRRIYSAAAEYICGGRRIYSAAAAYIRGRRIYPASANIFGGRQYIQRPPIYLTKATPQTKSTPKKHHQLQSCFTKRKCKTSTP